MLRTEASGNHFTVKETPNGREMICTIDAKPGDLIFCEQAFAIAPTTTFLTSKYENFIVALFYCVVIFIYLISRKIWVSFSFV